MNSLLTAMLLLLATAGTPPGDVAGVPTDPAPALAADWQPDAADQEAVERFAYRYFSAKDHGDYARAYAMFTSSMQQSAPIAGWKDAAEGFHALAGKSLGREIRKLTWYVNPPAAPRAGLYVGVSFAGRFENLELHCGYLMLYRLTDRGFEIIREEEGYLGREQAARLPARELSSVPSKLRCVPRSPSQVVR